MKINCFALAALAAFALVVPTSRVRAQSNTAPSTDSSSLLPRVFVDCRAYGCDDDFLRTELTWMNFVRDRNQALVHVIATSRSTAGGGSELTVTFQPQTAITGAADSIIAFIPQGATEDGARRVLSRSIAQGMLRYVKDATLASQLTVSYAAPKTKVTSDTRGAKDKWHLWVVRTSASGYTNGDENYKSASLYGSVRASRITNAWKANFSVSGNYRENSYQLSETERLNTYLHGYNADATLVKSISPRLSLGAQSYLVSSVQSNQDLTARLSPAIEFDLFPYAQSTRKQVVVRYGPGIRYANYHEYTIYDKLSETHPDHQLLIASELTQPWGSVSASTTFKQLLDEPSKSNFDVNGFVSWRIVTGLNLNFGGGYTRIRDQLNLKRGEQEAQDVLLQLRQLRTGYSYYANVGLSFTFGSIFSNVVNPRFSQTGGSGF